MDLWADIRERLGYFAYREQDEDGKNHKGGFYGNIEFCFYTTGLSPVSLGHTIPMT